MKKEFYSGKPVFSTSSTFIGVSGYDEAYTRGQNWSNWTFKLELFQNLEISWHQRWNNFAKLFSKLFLDYLVNSNQVVVVNRGHWHPVVNLELLSFFPSLQKRLKTGLSTLIPSDLSTVYVQ